MGNQALMRRPRPFGWADVAMLAGSFGGILAALVTLATETTWWKVALTAGLGTLFVLGLAGNWSFYKKRW